MNVVNLTFVEILFTFGTALFLSACFTPLALKLALRLKIVDKPNPRKTHQVPVPYLGGVAIYLAFLVSATFFLPLNREMWGMLIGGTVLMLIGAIDDSKDISAVLRLLVQIGCAVLAVRSGIVIEGIGIPFVDKYLKLRAFGPPLTVLWIVTVTNIMNFIDGLDGLAAGTAAIASLTLTVVAWRIDAYDVVVLALALGGACLGFLFYNFHPAKIFMGDAGALFIGFVLACLSVKGPMKVGTFATMLVPVFALGLPLLDTAVVFIRRIKAGNSPMKADRQHVHHVLYDSGLTQRQTVIWLYAISACLGFAAVEVNNLHGRVISLAVGVLGIILFVVARSQEVKELSADTKNYKDNFQQEVQEELKRRKKDL